jgi:hypothetical protein
MKKHEVHLGTIPSADSKRDAVHVAVVPVEAGERLQPGDDICIIAGAAFRGSIRAIGIADPFISGPIPKGSLFWLLLFPKTVENLRHDLDHPSFPREVQADPVEEYDECSGC